MAIYDTMQYVPNDIVTVGIGMAASMGQFLLSSGAKGKRYATPKLSSRSWKMVTATAGSRPQKLWNMGSLIKFRNLLLVPLA